MNNPLDSLLYITVSPEQIQRDFSGLDPSIPLPVRIPEPSFGKEFKPEDIILENYQHLGKISMKVSV